ncbi:MAG: TIM barrel protein [Thermomicrobiales bacterium]
MPKIAANLTMLFTELPVLDRFAAASDEGFAAVEFLFPYDHDPDAIKDALDRKGLEMVLFDLPVGDFAAGDRGLANDPAKRDEFERGAVMTAELAERYGTPLLNCLVGKELAGVPSSAQREALVENLRFAAEETEKRGVRLLVEPLNTIETSGFLIATARDGMDLIEEVGHDNLWLQLDIYHEQRMAGNLVATLNEYIDRIGHIQIADSPGRHQPGSGEINYRYVLDAIDESGYSDWVALEFAPSPDTKAALAEMRRSGLL